MRTQNSSQLYAVSCLALFVTSLSVAIRANVFARLATEFGLAKTEIDAIAATSYWGFPAALVIGGLIIDYVGTKPLLLLACSLHIAGAVLGMFTAAFSNPFGTMFIFNLLIGIANGIIEAACNPLVVSLYPDKKTTRLNQYHLWFPVGILFGTVLIYFFEKAAVDWTILVGTMLIPSVIYGFMFARMRFPATQRVANNISTRAMYKSLINPFFILMMICMLGTSATELFTGEWIELILKKISDNSIALLSVTVGVTLLGRAFAAPVVRLLSPKGVLVSSSVLALLGLLIIGNGSGGVIFAGAAVFSLGVCYWWPTMLGIVAEYLPKTGALGINLMSAAGALSVSFYLIFFGRSVENLISEKLPAGTELVKYNADDATEEMRSVLAKASMEAAPGIINTVLLIPVALVIAFSATYIYIKKSSKPVLRRA